jgi:tetratricopeptide (TPR) repeat protein
MIDAGVTFKALAVALALASATSSTAQTDGGAEPTPDVLSEDAQVLLDRLGALAIDDPEAARLAAEIRERWTHSGSAAMDLLLRRGQEAIDDEDYPRAIAHLTALTDHAPDFAAAWNLRATAFFLMERYGPALSDIEQVLILEPRHFSALSGLGIILERLDEPEGALRAFRAAQAAHPADENVNAAVERLEVMTGGRAL